MNRKISFPMAIIIIVAWAVLAGGIVIWQYFSIPETEIPPFTPSEKPPAEVAPKDETADWKTYRNEEMGFLIKYPPKWESPSEGYGGIMFDYEDESGSYSGVLVSKSPNYDDEIGRAVTFEEVIADFKNKGEEIIFIITGEKVQKIEDKQIIIDNAPAIKLCWLNKYESKDCIVFIVLEKYLLNINCQSEQKICENTFNQMLSTFRFLE